MGGKAGTSLVDDVQGAVDDVVELEGVVRLREALQVQRVVLQRHQRRRKDQSFSLAGAGVRDGIGFWDLTLRASGI